MPNIIVNVVAARDIPGEFHEKSDPYVKIKYGRQHHSTRTDKNGGRNPNFNQELTFELREEPYVFEVEIFDNDPLKDDKLARGLIEFRPAVENGSLNGTFPLQGEGLFGGHRGDIILEIRLEG